LHDVNLILTIATDAAGAASDAATATGEAAVVAFEHGVGRVFTKRDKDGGLTLAHARALRRHSEGAREERDCDRGCRDDGVCDAATRGRTSLASINHHHRHHQLLLQRSASTRATLKDTNHAVRDACACAARVCMYACVRVYGSW
jgi:hypothetical protein